MVRDHSCAPLAEAVSFLRLLQRAAVPVLASVAQALSPGDQVASHQGKSVLALGGVCKGWLDVCSRLEPVAQESCEDGLPAHEAKMVYRRHEIAFVKRSLTLGGRN